MKTTPVLMMVDDDLDDHELFVDALKVIDPAIPCISAFDCDDALDKLKKVERLPDVIFLDINMPRSGGHECLTSIRKTANWLDIPVVIYSTAYPHDAVETYKKLGATCLVPKPVFHDGIVQVIELALQKNWQELEAYGLNNSKQ